VLPFANTGGDSADAHFADGLTDELIGALGRVRGLRVVGRTSSFALRDAGLDVRAIADTLQVGTVLEGSVRRAGGRLRVVAQLVAAGDGAILWSETYDRGPRDVFAVQEEIARAIAGALRLRLTPGAAALVGQPTGDSAAYELYLRGRYVFNTQFGREGTLRSLRYFEQAAARDPAFARAHAGRSDAYARLAIFGYGRPRELFPRAREAALRALALDPTLAEAHVALAHALFVYDFAADSSDRTFRRAFALEPGYTHGRIPFAISLAGRERYPEALAQLDTARLMDPLAPAVSNMRGRILVAARRPELAVAALREALELNPQLDLSYQQLGHAYLQLGRPADAIAALRRAAALSGPRDSAQLAYAYAVTGDRPEARKIVRALLDGPADRYVPAFHVAMAYAGLGDVDEAFRWLERAYTERDPFVGSARITMAFEPLHGDRRWRALLRRMGL
jgi:TolB-like protein/Tfp pilus assembly protein PilF